MPNDNLLPEKINVLRLPEASGDLRGSYLIKDLTRLCDSLLSQDGQVNVELQFGVDEEKISFVKGHIDTEVMLQCQRCMESFRHEIHDDFISAIVKTEEEGTRLPERYDVMVLEEGMLLMQERIEDELIVSLPIVPMHDPKDCKVAVKNVLLETNPGTLEERENPFKVIEILRSKN